MCRKKVRDKGIFAQFQIKLPFSKITRLDIFFEKKENTDTPFLGSHEQKAQKCDVGIHD